MSAHPPVDATNHPHGDDPLAYYERMQGLLVDLAERFINLEPQWLNAAIEEALQRMGRFVEADRAYVFEYDFDADVTNNTHEWCGRGIEPQIQQLQGVPLDAIPDWVQSHQQGQTLYIPKVADLPEGNLRELLAAQDIQSLIAVPMVNAGDCLGFVGFDSVRRPHDYSEQERRLLSVFAQMLVNVTNRARADEQLRRKTDELEGFFSTALDLLCIADDGGRFVKVNRSWADLLGYHAEDLVGKPFIDFVHPEDVSATEQALAALSVGQTVDCFVNRYRAANGSYRSIEWRSISANGLIYAAARDVTQRLELENQLALARDKAEAANRAKSEFLANMSHEIRTPMTAIMGYADLLNLPQADPEEFRDWSTQIRLNANHLLMLLNDLLDLSRIEAGRMPIEAQPCELEEILRSLEALMRPRAQQKDLRFGIIDDHSAPRRVLCDPTRLRQILFNLASNAIKFTDEGSVTVWVSLEPSARGQGPERLRIAVQDTGIGIDPDLRAQLFSPFTQVHAHGQPRGGSGLGLAVSQRLAELMGGRIELQSTPGRGSTFTLVLPLAPETSVLEAPQAGGTP